MARGVQPGHVTVGGRVEGRMGWAALDVSGRVEGGWREGGKGWGG